MEEHSSAARFATIESKRELIQIRIQVRGGHRTLMSSQQPTLQQGCYRMDTRHDDVRLIACSRQAAGR
jgi:hypothetical protein